MNSGRDSKTEAERIVPMRLQKFLARAGVASRRGSENLMTAGRVCVNGRVVTELGSKVDPLVDEVTVDGRPVRLADGPVTIMLNKPAGVITTMKAQSDVAIVADLVPTDRYPGLFPIGRLDADTTGILLFSTDGELGNGLTHPRHHVEKTYLACIDRRLDEKAAEALRTGVELDDGMAQPAQVEVLAGRERARALASLAEGGQVGDVVRLVIKEGRYHQVKRMFEAVGRSVSRLHREKFGPLGLGPLPSGSWRELSEGEVAALRSSIQ